MKAADLERLMNDVLDGVATPEEEALLERRLATDAQARVQHRELKDLFDLLAGLPAEDPPPELRAELSRALAAASRSPAPSRWRPAWVETLRAAFARRPVLGAASAFATGALTASLAVLAFTRSLGPAAPGLPVSGTMARPTGETGSLVDSRQMRAGSAAVAIQARREADRIQVQLAVRPAGPAEIELEFDPEQVMIEDVHGSAPLEMHSTAGRVRLEAGTDVRYLLTFRARGEPRADLNVTLRSGKESAKEVLRMTPAQSIP